jgi:hypothetical protein
MIVAVGAGGLKLIVQEVSDALPCGGLIVAHSVVGDELRYPSLSARSRLIRVTARCVRYLLQKLPGVALCALPDLSTSSLDIVFLPAAAPKTWRPNAAVQGIPSGTS